MKKLSIVVALLMTAIVAQASGNKVAVAGATLTADAPVNISQDILKSTPYKYQAVDRGVQRVIQNLGTGYIYECKQGSSSVTTTGIAIAPGSTYIEDKYFGDIWLQSDTVTNNVRLEYVQSKY